MRRLVPTSNGHPEEGRKQNDGQQESRKTAPLAQMIRSVQEEHESRRQQGEARKIEFS